jgi:hypothetical protein
MILIIQGRIIMSLSEVLEGQGIMITVFGDELRLSPKEKVTPGVIKYAKANKPELIAEIKNKWHYLTVFSGVLGRNIEIRWQDKNPQVIYVDKTSYNTDEIDKLNNERLTREDIRVIHHVKEIFKGEIDTNPAQEGKANGKEKR